MHLLLTSLLAVAGFQLVHADPAKARVTQAPTIPKLFRRQSDDICPPGAYTLCDDGFGCCESGSPCTTIRGEPACDSNTCNGSPCGDAGLCCEDICSSYLGTAICVQTGFGGFGDDTDSTIALDEPTTTTEDTLTTTSSRPFTSDEDPTETETPTESTEDLPTIPTPTATRGPSFGSDDASDTATQSIPTQTGSGNGDSISDILDSINDSERGGGGGTDGAGIVSPRGTFAMMVLVAVGGAFLR